MNNTNLFDWKSEFFIIDSDNLDDISTRLYGYAVVDNCLCEDAGALDGRQPVGDGAYVYVKRDGDRLTLTQDFIGSYGLYLFQENDYFAISNSFIILSDHVKRQHRITFNQCFADYMLGAELCSASYSETLINEITLLDRSSVIEIDVLSKELEISYVDYMENTVELNSKEGMRILDGWYRKWTGLIRNIFDRGGDIQIDLSGGFDSRMVFNLLRGSGADLNAVYVNSIEDQLHTHKEDYEIASEIGDFYGFELNNQQNLCERVNYYTIADSLNISFNLKLGFHKQMYPRWRCFEKPLHYFGGSGGECVRSYWSISRDEYIIKAVNRCRSLPKDISERAMDSTDKILSASFDGIKNKYASFGRSIAEEDLALFLYRETRCRIHFGKDLLENYYGGAIKYAPLLDKELHRLKLNDSNCSDRNLLMAVMLDRFNYELLNFRYDSGRKIEESTIEYARSLNKKFPVKMENKVKSSSAEKADKYRLFPKNSNTPLSNDEIFASISQILLSAKIRNAFTLVYSDDVYEAMCKDVQTRAYQPLQSAYTVIGIGKLLQSVLTSEDLCRNEVAEAFGTDLAVNCSDWPEKSLLDDEYLINFVTARVDIVNSAESSNDIEILTVSDHKAQIVRASWLADNENGYYIESCKGDMTLTIRCVNSGELTVVLRSHRVLNEKKNIIPFWIDYHSFSINEKACLNDVTPVWHNKPVKYSRKVYDGELVTINLKWTAHNGAQWFEVPAGQKNLIARLQRKGIAAVSKLKGLLKKQIKALKLF